MSKITDALPGWCNVDNIAGLSQAELNAAMRQYAQQCIEARNQQGDAEYPAVMLTRMGHTEMCEVSLCIGKEWVTVLRDNGTNISHIVEPLGIRRAIEQRKADKKGSGN